MSGDRRRPVRWRYVVAVLTAVAALGAAWHLSANPTIRTKTDNRPPFGSHHVRLNQDVKSWMPSPVTPAMTIAAPAYSTPSQNGSGDIGEFKVIAAAMRRQERADAILEKLAIFAGILAVIVFGAKIFRG